MMSATNDERRRRLSEAEQPVDLPPERHDVIIRPGNFKRGQSPAVVRTKRLAKAGEAFLLTRKPRIIGDESDATVPLGEQPPRRVTDASMIVDAHAWEQHVVIDVPIDHGR